MNKVLDKFKETVQKFIHWINKKVSISEEEDLIINFQIENDIYLDPEKQIQYEKRIRI